MDLSEDIFKNGAYMKPLRIAEEIAPGMIRKFLQPRKVFVPFIVRIKAAWFILTHPRFDATDMISALDMSDDDAYVWLDSALKYMAFYQNKAYRSHNK